ncbi:iron-sulfur cluster biosynthesis family protein [Gracilibacillus sp. YIM 98692]|uniref:iron-sulfur cluster biosynthesis family protein n=1 Tax=Gracilibacillus sp. YIM 98692 TaxID=2663532 RepID=UPI0013CF4C93|nr:iron-sulfur cluster biosynthesis family protein [Gracilibacillus sp. YIM 98692]
MKLQITKEAISKLKELQPHSHSILALKYDTDGCGCGVNGMPTIEFKMEQDKADKLVENDVFTVTVHYHQSVFFANKMRLDFNGQTFRLSSNEGVLNPFISINQLTA